MSELLNKILTHQQLTEEEVRSICRPGSWDTVIEIDFRYHILDEFYDGVKRRWTIPVKVIFSVFDAYGSERCFSLEYDEALTELQEDFFYEQVAVEVERKYITTQVWVRKQNVTEE